MKSDGTLLAIKDKIKREYEKPVTVWEDKDLDKFLLDSKLISKNTVDKYIWIIRKLSTKKLNPLKDKYDYIDIPQLRSKTLLSMEEFLYFRNHIIIYTKGDKRKSVHEGFYNHRDAAMLGLAYNGLTSKEIQNLKEEDLILEGNKYRVQLKNRKDIFINIPEIVEDITNTKSEKQYLKFRKKGDKLEPELADYQPSPYLIKGIKNRAKLGEPILSPGRMLQIQLSKILHPIIDGEHLSIEDIRRSLIIQMYNSEENINTKTIQSLLDKNYIADIQWLKHAARKLLEHDKELKKYIIINKIDRKLILREPPKKSFDKPKVKKTIRDRDFNYNEQEAKNKEVGKAGERLVLEEEKRLLINSGCFELAEKVNYVKDGMGYDIISYTLRGNKKYIEVKTTTGRAETPFFITYTELDFSNNEPQKFSLVRVYNYNKETDTAEYYKIEGPIKEDEFCLEPILYKALR